MIPIVAIVITISFHLSPALLVFSSHPVLSPAASQFHLESAGYRQEILSNSCFETPKKYQKSMEPGADFVGSFATEAFDAYISRNPQPMPDVISIVISDSRETISMSPSPSRSLERSEASSLSAMEILGRNGIFGKISFYSQPLVKYSKILDLVGG